MIMGPVLLMIGLFVGLMLVSWLIASDKTRFLTRFDLSQWRPAYYQRALPNFLQALHDHHFTSAWPAKRNAVAVAMFRHQARRLLKRRPTNLRRAFLQQHITLFALMEILQPFLKDYVLHEQQRIAGDRLINMEDTIERDRLLDFVEAARAHRARFHASLTTVDRITLNAMIERRFIPTIKTAHAIFQEHGYSLMPELTHLRRLDDMNGAELVHELPALPPVRKSRRVALKPR